MTSEAEIRSFVQRPSWRNKVRLLHAHRQSLQLMLTASRALSQSCNALPRQSQSRHSTGRAAQNM